MIIHHYTNIDVLALILKNHTLRFTRLDQVDDPEESNFICKGVNLGPYTFVSCWTEVKEESIPMWKMYTKGKWGVRLSFKKDGLFKTYTDYEYKGHDNFITEVGKEIHFILDPKLRWNQTDYMPPFLTDDYDACNFYRKIKYVDDIVPYADGCVEFPEDPKTEGIEVKTDKVGSYKNKRWAFQEESRFVMFFAPGNPLAYFNTEKYIPEQIRQIRAIKNNEGLSFSYYDMNLNEEAFENLVITMSPLCEPSQKIMVEALCKQYASSAQIVDSNLSGKLVK